MPVAFSSSANLGRFCPQRTHDCFANQSIMTIRSARTQSVELAVPLTTLNNISFGCLRERPSLAFPERPRDVNGSQNKETQPGWAAVHTPHFPFAFFSGSGEPGKTRKRTWLCKKGRKERERGKEGRREGETENEDGGERKRRRKEKLQKRLERDGGRNRKKGNEERKEGEREREKLERERDRQRDREAERDRASSAAVISSLVYTEEPDSLSVKS